MLETKLLQKSIKDNVDRLLACETADQVSAVMQTLLFDPTFQQALDRSIQDSREKEKFYELVRSLFSPIYEKCGFLKHGIQKPYGYPGDFEAFEYAYDGIKHQSTPADYAFLDEYVFSLTLYRAICERKNLLKLLLEESIEQGSKRFCSIGAGSARELFELAPKLDGMKIELMDFDQRALDFASQRLSNRNIEVTTKCVDARRLDYGEDEYDVIYSFGLFDYVSDQFVNRILRSSVKNLSEEGKIIFALKDSRYFNPWFYDLFTDMQFVTRTPEEAKKILEKNSLELDRIIPTENNAIYLIVCEKK